MKQTVFYSSSKIRNSLHKYLNLQEIISQIWSIIKIFKISNYENGYIHYSLKQQEKYFLFESVLMFLFYFKPIKIKPMTNKFKFNSKKEKSNLIKNTIYIYSYLLYLYFIFFWVYLKEFIFAQQPILLNFKVLLNISNIEMLF